MFGPSLGIHLNLGEMRMFLVCYMKEKSHRYRDKAIEESFRAQKVQF